MASVLNYFLGGIGPTGYVGFFDPLVDNDSPLRVYLLKGGPGCGKSSLMRRMAARALAAGHDIEQIRCAGDPDSLDGVICPALGFVMLDGTAPHALEPAIPVAKQAVLSLYHCIDSRGVTAELGKLRPLFDQNAQYAARARRFITAAGSLHYDITRTAAAALNVQKATRYAGNLAAKWFPRGAPGQGHEQLRFTCAFTPRGMVDHAAANYAGCRSIHIFEDRFGAAAPLMLDTIRRHAMDAGLDIITARSPLAAYDKIDSVYVPALSAVFAHSGYLAPLTLPGAHLVHDRRFYDETLLAECQKRLGFCKRAALELLAEGCALLAEAKKVHDQIEAVYTANFDFEQLATLEKECCVELGLEY